MLTYCGIGCMPREMYEPRTLSKIHMHVTISMFDTPLPSTPVLLYVQKCLKKIIVDRHLLNYLDECNILQFKSVFAGEFGDIMYV